MAAPMPKVMGIPLRGLTIDLATTKGNLVNWFYPHPGNTHIKDRRKQKERQTRAGEKKGTKEKIERQKDRKESAQKMIPEDINMGLKWLLEALSYEGRSKLQVLDNVRGGPYGLQ